jgi:hypothetical protein
MDDLHGQGKRKRYAYVVPRGWRRRQSVRQETARPETWRLGRLDTTPNLIASTYNTATPYLFDNHLLDLFNHLINPLLNLLFCLLASNTLQSLPAMLLVRNITFAPCPPCIPFVDQPLTMRNQLGADVAFLCRIFFIKCAAVFLQVSTDLSLLLLC